MSQENNIFIIGGGASGILMACQLQRELNFSNFEIFEKDKQIGGTWYANTYPGCACDVPSHFYSFSFAKNPNWSQLFSPQPEIQQYMLDVAKKYGLPERLHLRTEFLGAEWDNSTQRWTAHFRSLETNKTYSKSCKFIVAACGPLSVPNSCPVPGLEKFKGQAWHSSRWRHDVSIKDKDVVVIGNGCSAAQLVPVIVPQTKTLTQFIRSPHWILPRPNMSYSDRFKWVMRNIPGAIHFNRYLIATLMDISFMMFKTDSGKWLRDKETKEAVQFMTKTAPEKYHDLLIPKFQLGTKRRIYDANYLQSLHNPKLLLTNDPLVEIKEKTVLAKSGKEYPADVIVYANGFQIHELMATLTIKGKSGETLNSRWKRQGGMRAYMGIMVADFPNFFTIIGPNSASGHYSIIYMAECQAKLINKILKPLLKSNGPSSVEVTEEAEKKDVDWAQTRLKDYIWGNTGEAGWYIDKKTGHNGTVYPHYQSHYWLRTFMPVWTDFKYQGVKAPKYIGPKMLLVIVALIVIVMSWLIMAFKL